MKALVLAAGLGSRLSPITNYTPKPLIPILGKPLLYWILDKIFELNIDEIAINTHYMADQIEDACKKHKRSKDIQTFHEKEILGTGGVYKNIEGWRGKNDLLVINGDIFYSPSLQNFVTNFKTEKPTASMLTMPTTLNGKRPIWTKQNSIIKIGEKPNLDQIEKKAFTGIHILSDDFFRLLPKEKEFDIIPIYQKALMDGKKIIHMETSPDNWFDLGTSHSYLNFNLDFLSKHQQDYDTITSSKKLPEGGYIIAPVYIKKGARLEIDATSTIGPNTLVYADLTMQPHSTIKNSVVLDSFQCEAYSVFNHHVLSQHFCINT